MATADQPITKADLQAELRYYATEEDTARLEGKIDIVANVLMIRLGGLFIVVASVLFAALRYFGITKIYLAWERCAFSKPVSCAGRKAL